MNDKLESLQRVLESKIRGQDHIIPKVCSVLKRGERNLNKEDKPKGTFLLLGPTGVGKTETALTFTDHLFGGNKLFRFDMSEYMHLDSIKLLLGDETGYTGRLGEILSNHSCGTLLFDEMEKAHVKILDIFLQILAPGRVTVGKNITHDLKGFYIVMTTNIGGHEVMRMSNLPMTTIQRTVLDVLSEELRPELINRFQEKIVFNKLSFTAQREIAQISLNDEVKRLASIGYRIVPSPASLEFLIRHGIDKIHGARPMKRCVEKFVQDAVSLSIDEGRSGCGDLVVDPTGKFLVIKESREG